MRENERGFHHPASRGHDHNRGGSSGGERGGGGKKAMAEPTNHGGHTHEMARRHEHDARVDAIRDKRGGYHEAPGHVTQSKHGAEHHIRNGERTEGPTVKAEEAAEGIE